LAYKPGYWAEIQNQRVAGGVRASIKNVEFGVGALWKDEAPGVTGYAAYSVGLLKGRLDVNWQEGSGVGADLSLGLSLGTSEFAIQPFISMPVSKLEAEDNDLGMRFGVRLEF